MREDKRRFYADAETVRDRARSNFDGHPYGVAQCDSHTMARRIAAALNIYKIRPRKRAEKK